MPDDLKKVGVQLTVDDQAEFNTALKKANDAVLDLGKAGETASQGLDALGEMATGALRRVGELAINGIGVLAGALIDFGKSAIDSNAQFEKFAVQFEVMLGSAEAAQARLAMLAEFGAKTPFELPQVVEADKIIQGFGLHSAEAAAKFGSSGEDILRIAGDVASGTGAGFSEMALLIGKFSAGATGEAISRFQELGITTREEMTKMGLQFSKSGELLSSLPEAMKVVLKIMQDKYGGMMDKQSTTFEGMVSNLQDWVGQMQRELGKPIFDALKDSLGKVLELLNSKQVRDFISNLASGIGVAITSFTDFVGKAIEPFITGVMEGWGAIDVLATGIGNLLLLVGSGNPVLESMGNFLINSAAGMQKFVSDALAPFILGLQQGWPLLDILTFGLGKFFLLIAGDNQLLKNLGAWFINEAPAAFEGFYNSVLEFIGPIIQWVTENWPTVQAVFEEVMLFIGGLVDAVLVHIKNVFDEIMPDLKNNVGNILKQMQTFWDKHGEEVKTILAGILALVTIIIKNLISIIGAGLVLISGVISAFWSLVNGDTDSAYNTMLSSLETALDLMLGILGTNLETVRRSWQTVFESVIVLAKTFWNSVVMFFTNGLNSWKYIWDTFGSVVKNAWQGIVDSISKFINDALAKMQKFVMDIILLINNLIGKIKSIASLGGIKLSPSFNSETLGAAMQSDNSASAMVSPVASAAQISRSVSYSNSTSFNYSPTYQSAPRNPSADFAMMQVLAA